MERQMKEKNLGVPEKVKNGLTFYPVPDLKKAEHIFGADRSMYFQRKNGLPDVPEKYEKMASKLFFHGGKLPDELKLKNPDDIAKAFRYISGMLSSFAPAHEEKITTVAYAFWVWCESEELE
jgi:hypothetical protein